MAERRVATKAAWYLGLLIIFAGAMWVPFYNRLEPRLFGVPFFYWFQFSWIIVTAIATALAYKARL
ncbi:MAG TPA: DUF3311 domain-containing protein [Gammaproteobacteria bacterium]|nr:DUF3311 domain-containing protein [Gammaproteobacteria bacterium]HET7587773.1 DUF3311 domain-containing protein [Gammaproteobacteria bacterium]